MKLRLYLTTLALLLGCSALTDAAPKPVELILNSKTLEPTTTFEVRFAEAMVTSEQIATVAETPPIVFRPAVPGHFKWLSDRSGIFTPEAPLPLSTTFQLTLAPEVAKADGTPLTEEFSETVQTPPMGLKGWHSPDYIQGNNAPAEPRFSLLFNVDVDPGQLERFCKFVNKGGEQVPARVVAADSAKPEQRFPSYQAKDGTLLTWAERFTNRSSGQSGDGTPRGNHLFVRPAQPLPAGEGWVLEIAAGAPAREGRLRVLDKIELTIGTVRPFEIQTAQAANALNHGRRLEVTFTKPLSRDLTVGNWQRWMQVRPAPNNLKAEISGNRVAFSGDFELGTPYQLEVRAGLPADQPFVLPSTFERSLTFTQVPSRLYSEDFQAHQLTTGRRQFQLLAVNVSQIKVTAKLFPSDTLAAALKAYSQYERYRDPSSSPDDDGFTRVDPEQIPGQVIWQKVIPGPTTIDEELAVTLDWNEILGEKQNGVVLLTAEQMGKATGTRGLRPGVQSLIQVTDLGVVWKRSAKELFVDVFSMTSAKPAAGTKVQLLDETGATLAEAQTDATGIAQLPIHKEAHWLLADSGADRHLATLSDYRNELHASRFRSRFSEGEDGDDEGNGVAARPTFLFSDRPVYKPGETVHLKGIARDCREGQARIPAGVEVELTARDARERTFFTKKVKLSEDGSLGEDIKLPLGNLGQFSVQVSYPAVAGEESEPVTHQFEVQEYRPNAFEITIGSPGPVLGGGEITLPVSAKYYMGKALSSAQLSWSIEAEDVGFAPDGFGKFAFCSAINDYRIRSALQREGHFAQQDKAELDESGEVKISANIPINLQAPQPRSARVLCEITDLNQQTVSNASTVIVHASDFYLGLGRPAKIVREGELIPIELVAVQANGQPTAKPVSATARLIRIDWQTNRVQGAGYSNEYRNEPNLALVGQTTLDTRVVTKTEGKWTAAGAAGTEAALLVDKPGDYLLEAVAKDAGGREVRTELNVRVYGKDETTWNYRNPYEIELVPDKDAYLSGQSARILVKTPIQGTALVTVEREKVLRSFVTTLEGNAPSVEIPLEGIDAPNVFVSVLLLRGAEQSPRKLKMPEYRMGYCELKVKRLESQLQVKVLPSAKDYRPGDPVTLVAEVLDFQGAAVADAEVTLYAVDEGVLSLMGYETPEPLKFFSAERALAVTTGLTLPSLLEEEAEERSFGNKGYLIGDGGEGKDSVRKNFVACAFWHGALRTDGAGHATATFPAPDGLTRYRVIAVVQTRRDQFGNAESAFEINKPLMLEPSLPRFANVGDQLALRAVVHNTTDYAGEVEVTLDLDETARAEGKTRRITLEPHGSKAVDFPVEFTEVGKAVWQWTARFVSAEAPTAFRDAVQTELKVGYPTPLLREIHVTSTEDADTTLLERLDPQLVGGTGVVRVSVSNSRLLELRESLRELLHYPYGCVEQTTSSTLPWLTLRDLRKALPELNRSDAEIVGAVDHGVERLLKMQTTSGGLSYWPGETQPLFWGSAYGGFGLALAKRQGFAVPEAEFDRLMKYLSAELRGTAQVDDHYGLAPRCLALYALALAGRSEPAYHELLFQKRATLSRENRALLAMAIAESGGTTEMVKELLKPAGEDTDSEYWFGGKSRAIAMRLLAWNRIAPTGPEGGELVAELLGSRRQGHWWTTQLNAWSVLALADYAKRVESVYPSNTGTVTWGAQNAELKFGGGPQLVSATFPLKGSDGLAAVRLSNPGRNRVFTEVMVEAQPKLIAQPAQDRGYSIRREYRKINDDGTTGELKEARVGDRVLVLLDIEVRKNASYVAVDDPLPANFEAVNPAFKSQETAGGNQASDWLSSYHELREDRALFFANQISPGHYRIRYLARVCAAGSATAPAAKIEEMYYPERCGFTATSRVVSLPLK